MPSWPTALLPQPCTWAIRSLVVHFRGERREVSLRHLARFEQEIGHCLATYCLQHLQEGRSQHSEACEPPSRVLTVLPAYLLERGDRPHCPNLLRSEAILIITWNLKRYCQVFYVRRCFCRRSHRGPTVRVRWSQGQMLAMMNYKHRTQNQDPRCTRARVNHGQNLVSGSRRRPGEFNIFVI